MKVQVKKIKSVIGARILDRLIWIFFWFTVSLLFAIFYSAATTGTGDVNIVLFILMCFMAPFVYIAYLVLDTKMYAQNACVELKENSVDLSTKNLLNQQHVSLPISQINDIHIKQGFFDKLFGLSVLLVTQENGETKGLWGFDYSDLKQLVSEFSSKYKIKTTK